jgi:predicted RNA-binding Zn-ribbon protein involved in translation (DUF1610 family)
MMLTRLRPPGRRHAFTCDHCGAKVLWATAPYGEITRNSCTECGWSKHTEDYTTGLGVMHDCPPCGVMMRPAFVGEDELIHRCLGCGFSTRGPTEARLDAYLAAKISGAVFNPPPRMQLWVPGREPFAFDLD